MIPGGCVFAKAATHVWYDVDQYHPEVTRWGHAMTQTFPMVTRLQTMSAHHRTFCRPMLAHPPTTHTHTHILNDKYRTPLAWYTRRLSHLVAPSNGYPSRGFPSPGATRRDAVSLYIMLGTFYNSINWSVEYVSETTYMRYIPNVWAHSQVT